MTTKQVPHSSGPSVAPEKVKAPLVGVLFGLAVVGGLGAWTAQRITVAQAQQADVEVQRTKDAEKAAAIANAPLKVVVTRGVATRWQPQVEMDGTLAAQQSASLSFKVPGKLARIGVRVGDEIKAGTLLASLDPREAAAQASASGAQVRAAEAQLALADDTQKRTATLVQNGAFAAAGAVQTEQQRALAQAQLDAARAQQALAQVSLGQHSLVAPFAGTVVQAPDGVGAVVGPGQTLFQLVNTKTMKLTTTISEADANLLAVGAKVVVEAETGTVEGNISALLSALDARTRRVPVVVDFPIPGPLRAGSFVRATVDAGKGIDVVRLPHDALRPGSMDEVLVVLPGEVPTLELRRIVHSLDKDGHLLVRKGLAATDQVVLRPKPEAKTGDKVEIDVPEGAKP
jgi:RND family efflux transporter MFP subunit